MKRVPARISILLIGLLLTGLCVGCGGKDDAAGGRGVWRMFRHDAQHTGRSPFVGPSAPTKKWDFDTGDDVYSSPAIGADGTVYVGSCDKKLYAIKADGTKKWEFATDAGSPAIGADGTIYVGSFDNKLYAIGQGP